MSGSEAARELGESQANVSYHLRRLRDAGLVVAVDEPGQRGRTQRYRHDPASGERLSGQGPGDQPVLAAALAAALQRRAQEHRPGTAVAFTDAELWVDPATWQRALAAVRDVGADLHEHAVAAGTDGAVRVSATISLFELDPGASA
jgi:DNA-binding transcriptional ArsR family regulator